MKTEIYTDLANQMNPGAPIHVIMRAANNLHDQNEAGWKKPYAEQDIRFAEFVSKIKETATQKEKDLVYISTFFYHAYADLHTTVMTLKEPLNDAQLEVVQNVKEALERLDMTNLLTDGLNKKTMAFLKNIGSDKPSLESNGPSI